MLPPAYRQVLASRRFRLLALGFGISSLGDGMSALAVAWLAIEISSPADRGLVVGSTVPPTRCPELSGSRCAAFSDESTPVVCCCSTALSGQHASVRSRLLRTSGGPRSSATSRSWRPARCSPPAVPPRAARSSPTLVTTFLQQQASGRGLTTLSAAWTSATMLATPRAARSAARSWAGTGAAQALFLSGLATLAIVPVAAIARLLVRSSGRPAPA
jgi:hypothetical protein